MNIFDAHISGSLSVSSSAEIQGDLRVLGIINATISGTTTNAQTASFAPSYTLTSSFNSFTSSYTTGSFTGSFIGDGTNLYNIPASGVTGLNLNKITSGSVSASISPNRGLEVNIDATFTGSVNVTGSLSLNGQSVETNRLAVTTFNSYTSSINPRISALETSTSSLNSFTSSINITIKNKLNSDGVISGSSQVIYSGLTGIPSGIVSGSSQVLNGTTIHSGSFFNGISVVSGSGQVTAFGFATTGSNTFVGNENINGSLSVTGALVVQSGSAVYNSLLSLSDTSSLILNSGSNLYVYDTGIISGNFKGTVTGALSINGNLTVTGSVLATGTSLVSGSSQIDITSTTNYTTFSSSLSSSIGSLSASIATTDLNQNNRLNSIEGVTGSVASLNTYTGSNNTIIGTLQTATSSLNSFSSSILSAVETTGSNLTVKGDLLVKGTTTQVDSTTVNIGDNIIQLNGTGATNAGIVVRDSTSPTFTSGSFLWDSTNDKWVAGPLGSEDEIVLKTASQALTNKTISGASNTLSDIANASLTYSSISIAGTSTSLGGSISAATILTSTGVWSGSAQLPSGVVSGSAQVIANLPAGTVSGSSQVLSGTGIWSGSAQLPSGVVSGSSQVLSGTGIWSGSAQLPSGVVSGSSQITFLSISSIPSGLVSGSSQVLAGTTIHSGSFFNGISVVSGSAQISFNGITDKPTLVSGSSQITYGSLSGIPSGIVSGSSQVLSGTGIWSGSAQLPSGVVSGSSQITFLSISSIPSGLVSGSSQVLSGTGIWSGSAQLPSGVVSGSSQISFGSISGVPSGLVSGSSQITGIGNSQLTNSSFYVGTTSISLGRSSASQTLTGVSIDGNAATVSNLTATQLYNNMGEGHSTRTTFDASTPSYGFGYRFVQGSTNGPGTGGSQFYSWYIGLGDQYPATGAGSYGAMFAVDRNVSTPYLSVRYNENNGFTSWRKMYAGYADSAGSVSGANVSGNISGNASNITSYTINQNVGSSNTPQFAGVDLTSRLYLNAGSYEGSILFGSSSTWRCGIRQHDDADAELRIWAKNANGMIFLATGYDGEPADISRPTDGLVVVSNNVGIGNFSAADPSYKLHVKGSAGIEGNLLLNNGGYGWIYANDTNHSIIMRGDRNGTAADYTNYYQYGGSIASGKGHKFWTGGVLASQTLRFHIADDYTYNTGNMTIGGTLTENSSIRYKKDIENITYGLDKVLQLRGVTYVKKENNVKEMGVIAEEIAEILPDVVLYDSEGKPDSVSYGRITAVLIEAIKDLKKELNELKNNG